MLKMPSSIQLKRPHLIGLAVSLFLVVALLLGSMVVTQIIKAAPSATGPNFPTGFTNAASSLQLNNGAAINGSALQLTDGKSGEQTTAYYLTPVSISSFTTQFTFQDTTALADGMTFVIQNAGLTAVGLGGGGLSYQGIGQSVAVKFDLFDNNTANNTVSRVAVFTNGAYPNVPDAAPSTIDFHSGHPIQATITFSAGTLQLNVIDTVTNVNYSQNFTVDIPTIVGNTTAYIGFTAATGYQTAVQSIQSWTFSNTISVPTPSATSTTPATVPTFTTGFANAGTSMQLNGSVISGNALQLTDGKSGTTTTAYFTTPLPDNTFSTQFTFQDTNALADGITFVMQNTGLTAVGAGGGGLGYQGIGQSVAVKFDLYDNGTGNDTVSRVAVFTGGAYPDTPDVAMPGIDFHAGHVMQATITYTNGTLQLTVLDTATNATNTQSFPVNIANAVGGATAYMGFTGASGYLTAIQNILSWTYSNTITPPNTTGPNFTAGFANAATSMQLNNGATINGTELQMTNGKGGETTSAFYTTPLSVTTFTDQFTFQDTNATADGMAFVIQNASINALGAGGGGLGYQGIGQSVAVKLDLYDNNSATTASGVGVFTGGAYPNLPNTVPTNINFQSGDVIRTTINYTNGTLTLTLQDVATNVVYTQNFTVNIPTAVGGNTALMGFTGATGSQTSNQNILTWTYSNTIINPTPGPTNGTTPAFGNGFTNAGANLQLNGGAIINGSTLQLTDNTPGESRSAYFTTPVSDTTFTSQFTFKDTNAVADGMTFVIQNAGLTAVGAGGGGLGYQDIGQSVAVKFDLYDNTTGNSTVSRVGVFTNGAMPDLPDTVPTGIDFHSGDTIQVTVEYTNGELQLTVQDMNTNATATELFTINVPNTIGNNMAYMGFTAATGGQTAVQSILTWTYTNTATITVRNSDWTQFLYTNTGTNMNTMESQINSSTISGLKVKWTTNAGGGMSDRVIESNNVAYWGSWDGNLHATNVTGPNAGTDIWTTNLGVNSDTSCLPPHAGVASTPVLGTINGTPVLFVGGGGNDAVGGGNAYVYAVNATTGQIIWKTVVGTSPQDFAWSSPVLYNGSVFYGMASFGDCPLTRGRLYKLDQTSGAIQSTFWTEPPNCVAGGIWGTPTIDPATGYLFTATGTQSTCFGAQSDYSVSLLEINTATMSYISNWQIPANQLISDADFGSAPLLFSAQINGVMKQLVGIANKDGTYYTFDRTNVAAGPIWTQTVSIPGACPQCYGASISPAVFDGSTIYVAGGTVMINGVTCSSSVNALSAQSGAYVWRACMQGGPELSALTGSAGVVVATEGTWIYALSMTSGAVLFSYNDTNTGSTYYAPASIANGYMFAGNMDGTLVAFGF